MLPIRLPDDDAVSMVLSTSLGRLEVSIGAALGGLRQVAVNGNVAGLPFQVKKDVKDAEIAGAIAPSLVAALSKLSESSPKSENDLFVDMTYKSKDHDIHETFTIPIRQNKIQQFMTLAGNLIQMQKKR